MTMIDETLDSLAPSEGWTPHWDDVLQRAGRGRLVTRRRALIAVAVALVVAIPLTAFGAANNWWFLQNGAAPTPTSAPIVVKTGTWEGKPWQFVAYPSTTDGLCWGITPDGSTAGGSGATLGCGPVTGVARTAQTKASPDMSITYVAGNDSPQLPSYIAGPVLEAATTVEIRLADGDTISTPTFAAPPPLDHVRFYVTRISDVTGFGSIAWLAGIDANGKIVACLAPQSADDGVSPLSACS